MLRFPGSGLYPAATRWTPLQACRPPYFAFPVPAHASICMEPLGRHNATTQAHSAAAGRVDSTAATAVVPLGGAYEELQAWLTPFVRRFDETRGEEWPPLLWGTLDKKSSNVDARPLGFYATSCSSSTAWTAGTAGSLGATQGSSTTWKSISTPKNGPNWMSGTNWKPGHCSNLASRSLNTESLSSRSLAWNPLNSRIMNPMSVARMTDALCQAVHSCSVLVTQRRFASLQPENVVYSGPSSPSPKRVTLNVLRKKYNSGEPITMVTAYDYPSAVHVDQALLDILLVGDSVGMVVHGHDTTLPVTLEDMLVHCRAVARGSRRAFLVGDLPFGSYETSTTDAVRSAVRMLKEGGMDAVKLEGGSPARVEAARAIVETGVAVMGHVGLTPQSISAIGGFRPQAQAAEDALKVVQQALALQAAGCFSLVLECVPAPIAAAITRAVSIPTIGIGAGPYCSGQVLVYHDLLGMMSHPHHAKVTPKFCKQYSQVGAIIQDALQQYRDDVAIRRFPDAQYSPYKIPAAELQALAKMLLDLGLENAAGALHTCQQDLEGRSGTTK